MERDLFLRIRTELAGIPGAGGPRGCLYSDAWIAEVYFWSVIHDRPVSWACRARNWPREWRRRAIPSQSRMSRRMKTASVRALIEQVDRRVARVRGEEQLVSVVDGKPLTVGNHSRDPHAAWGRGAGGKAKGYKLHALIALAGGLVGWRVAPLNIAEPEMARRMLRDARCPGYVLGDKNYDTNTLHDEALRHGGQLVAPRRRGADKGLGHHRHSPGRLRCRDLLENTQSDFGRELHRRRTDIERRFGYLVSTAGLLGPLPAWVRTYPRVRLWVQAKLILAALRPALRSQCSAA